MVDDSSMFLLLMRRKKRWPGLLPPSDPRASRSACRTAWSASVKSLTSAALARGVRLAQLSRGDPRDAHGDTDAYSNAMSSPLAGGGRRPGAGGPASRRRLFSPISSHWTTDVDEDVEPEEMIDIPVVDTDMEVDIDVEPDMLVDDDNDFLLLDAGRQAL